MVIVSSKVQASHSLCHLPSRSRHGKQMLSTREVYVRTQCAPFSTHLLKHRTEHNLKQLLKVEIGEQHHGRVLLPRKQQVGRACMAQARQAGCYREKLQGGGGMCVGEVRAVLTGVMCSG